MCSFEPCQVRPFVVFVFWQHQLTSLNNNIEGFFLFPVAEFGRTHSKPLAKNSSNLVFAKF